MKWKILGLTALLLAAPLFAEEVGQVYQKTVSATATNSPLTFVDNGSGGSAQTFRAIVILFRSAGASANTCYIDLKDTTATTADIPLEPGASIVFSFPNTAQPADGWPGVGIICDTAQTATIYVTAMR